MHLVIDKMKRKYFWKELPASVLCTSSCYNVHLRYFQAQKELINKTYVIVNWQTD